MTPWLNLLFQCWCASWSWGCWTCGCWPRFSTTGGRTAAVAIRRKTREAPFELTPPWSRPPCPFLRPALYPCLPLLPEQQKIILQYLHISPLVFRDDKYYIHTQNIQVRDHLHKRFLEKSNIKRCCDQISPLQVMRKYCILEPCFYSINYISIKRTTKPDLDIDISCLTLPFGLFWCLLVYINVTWTTQ